MIVAQIQAISPKKEKEPIHYKLLSTETSLPFAVLAENGAVIFINSTGMDDDPYCAILVAQNGNGRQTNATFQFGGRDRIDCSVNSSQSLSEHVLGGAHNLPFDYKKAKEEFLNNSLRIPLTTTTEEPGDKWTDLINPESTLSILTTQTTESIASPDEILSSTTARIQSTISTVKKVELTTAKTNFIEKTTVFPVYTAKEINTFYPYSPQAQIELMMSNAKSIDMACKNRDRMPMLQVLCDLAKSVFRTHA